MDFIAANWAGLGSAALGIALLANGIRHQYSIRHGKRSERVDLLIGMLEVSPDWVKVNRKYVHPTGIEIHQRGFKVVMPNRDKLTMTSRETAQLAYAIDKWEAAQDAKRDRAGLASLAASITKHMERDGK